MIEAQEATSAGGQHGSVLIVTVGTDYIAPARMPRELRKAGFTVTVLAPRNALAAKTRHVDKIGYFPDQPTVFDWIQSLVGAIRAVQPILLLPGDDITLRLLMQIVVEPLPALRPDAQQELAALIVHSLGDPAHYATSIDKSRLMAHARRLGVGVPDGDGVDDEVDAVQVASSLGYPVVVKPAIGSASAGVAHCDSEAAVRGAFRKLPRPQGWVPAGARRALVQRWVHGTQWACPALAWDGRMVAGFTRAYLQTTLPMGLGSSSRVRYRHNAALIDSNARLIASIGACGFLSAQYRVDAETGQACLLEINRRMVPPTHTGGLVGVDLAAALASVSSRGRWDGPTHLSPAIDREVTLFPAEWLRDPSSAHLFNGPTDAPWDDPSLFVAMLEIPKQV